MRQTHNWVPLSASERVSECLMIAPDGRCVGRTGAPLVDASMRQLWACGWMPRRMRLLCACALTEGAGTFAPSTDGLECLGVFLIASNCLRVPLIASNCLYLP
jgi:hypothetical protein